jgi:hypothetical protein
MPDNPTPTPQTEPFDLSKVLSNPETKAKIDAYVEEQKRGLLSAHEKVKERLHAYQIGEDDAGNAIYIKPDEAKKALESAKKKEKKPKDEDQEEKRGSEEDINKAIESARQAWIEKEHKPLSEENKRLRGTVEKIMIDNALQQALIEAKVHPPLLEGAKRILRDSLAIEEREGEFRVVVREKNELKFGANGAMTMTEFVKGFVTSDTGKAYVLADANSGGGSQRRGDGGNGVGFRSAKSKAELRAMGIDSQTAFVREFGREAFESLPLK